MKFTVAAAACLVSCAIASPVSEMSIVSRNAPFTDPTCKLSQAIPGTPLSFLFPTAAELGNILGPVLKGLIGDSNLEKIDKLADTLCVYVLSHTMVVPLYSPSYRDCFRRTYAHTWRMQQLPGGARRRAGNLR